MPSTQSFARYTRPTPVSKCFDPEGSTISSFGAAQHPELERKKLGEQQMKRQHGIVCDRVTTGVQQFSEQPLTAKAQTVPGLLPAVQWRLYASMMLL
jgi:hypothetical protein